MIRYAIIVNDEKTGHFYELQKKYATRQGAQRKANVINKTYPAWVEEREVENEK